MILTDYSQADDLFIGLMSGTSLDGVDAVLVDFSRPDSPQLIRSHFEPYTTQFRTRLLDLHYPQEDELHLCRVLALELSDLYSASIDKLLSSAQISKSSICAIGCHGQTIRHRPECGYTVQLVDGARLAELTAIASVTDFRSRDIAAGGQGAPLVPAFHQAIFSSGTEHRVIVNIGGIANLTNLHKGSDVHGFDCGPGNALMDQWALIHLGRPVDTDGAWATSGNVLPDLLSSMLSNPFFSLFPPKSAGREQFNLGWLNSLLNGDEKPQDVQASLLELTARSIIDAADQHCAGYDALYVCGGGVHNKALMARLNQLTEKPVSSSDEIGMAPDWVEAVAFAWLAKQCLKGKPGNLPSVTGAKGPRILGCIYPA